MSRKIWSVEKCKRYAKKCSTRTEMLKRYPRAYDAAVSHKWLEKIFSEHVNKGYNTKQKQKGYWSTARLEGLAAKCKNRKEFGKRFPNAMNVAYQRKILDEIFRNHINTGYLSPRLPKDHWKNKENCRLAANQCKTRSEFLKRFKAAYRSANRNGWYEELCAHMEIRGNLAERFVYQIIDLKSKEVYVGLTYNVEGRIENHKLFGRKPIKAMIKRGCKVLTSPKAIPVKLAQIEEARLIEMRRQEGFIVWNAVKAGALGAPDRYWTFDRCLAVAKKCKDRAEMREKYNGAIQTAVNFGWLDLLFKDHENSGFRHKPPGYWNFERIKKLASPYKTRGDFQKAERSAYGRAHSKGWLDKIFTSHEKNGFQFVPKGTWNLKTCKEAAERAKTRTKFYKDYPGAAKVAIDNNWMDKIFNSLPNYGYVRTPTNYWTVDRLTKEVEKYPARDALKKHSPSAFYFAQRSNILEKLFKNYPNNGLKYKPDGYWTIERSKREAKKYFTKMDLKKNAQGAYHCLRVNGLLETYFPKRSKPSKVK